MSLAVPLSLLLTSATGAAEATLASDVLARAARFYAPPEAAGSPLFRIGWLGTADLEAVDQARRPGLRRPARAQDLLIIDPSSVRAALDTQRIGADGTPGLWRHQILGTAGRSTNRKSGLTFDRVGPAATHLWQSLAWRFPQLAVAEMRAAPERILRVTESPGRVTVLAFEVSPGREVEVSVLPSGEISGYAYLSERLRGRIRTVTRFKPSVPAPGIGKLPRGYTIDIGAIRALDLDLLDARGTPGRDDPWLETPATDAAPRSTISAGPSRLVEPLWPGTWVVRNVGGYNAFLVDVGGCLLVFDAIASFGRAEVVPSPPPGRPLSEEVLAAAQQTVPDKRVCWVVPSHHHDDHFGGIVGLARAGATVLTTPGNIALARTVLRGVPDAKIEPLRGNRAFTGGPSRVEIRELKGLHADPLLFAWFPERRTALTADVTDYLTEEKRFLQHLESSGLIVETIHSVHSARPSTRADLEQDLDFSN